MKYIKHSSVFVIFLLAGFAIIQSGCEKEKDNVSYSEMELEILQLVNQYRLSNGLDQLLMNEVHYRHARSHTEYMISKNQISHENSSERFKAIGNELGSNRFGENVAAGYPTANDVVQAWLSSDGHRKNIEGDFTLTGISAIRNPKGQYYFTQIFSD